MKIKTLDYKTVKDAAGEWGVSRRYVNMCIENKRIRGIVKMGNMWLIPKDAQKPVTSPQVEKQLSEKSLASDLDAIFTATITPVPNNNPYAILQTVSEERLRIHYMKVNLHTCGVIMSR